jgi:hypothetical protein
MHWTTHRELIEEALADAGFATTTLEFHGHLTYERQIDRVKVHVDPSGAFAAFDAGDDIVGEGQNVDDLYLIFTELSRQAPRRSKVA